MTMCVFEQLVFRGMIWEGGELGTGTTFEDEDEDDDEDERDGVFLVEAIITHSSEQDGLKDNTRGD